MGSGIWTSAAFADYSISRGREYDVKTSYVTGQTYDAKRLDESLDPKRFTIRECINSEEHPNTIPVILALDVTGSMGSACAETAAALGKIMNTLLEKYEDIEFCIMGIGDLAYDRAPIQMSQFESDVRIAECLDKVYMEHGGGGNAYESYTAAWYMGLKHTKLDCFDKQGRKGIIITMGDEPLNPYLPVRALNEATNGKEQGNVETSSLYEEASKKFNIFHIAIDDHGCAYAHYKKDIEDTWGELLGQRFKVSSINELSKTIEDCISDSIDASSVVASTQLLNENGEITW